MILVKGVFKGTIRIHCNELNYTLFELFYLNLLQSILIGTDRPTWILINNGSGNIASFLRG